MRATPSVLAGLCLLVTLGCTHVSHRYVQRHPAGEALPIEVTVTHKAKHRVSGTVYYRRAGESRYSSEPMTVRAQQLWAHLPTEQYKPDDVVEYYIDVTKEDEMIPLGSPGAPYSVTFLDRKSMILANLHDRALASDSDHPVSIVLYAAGQPIGQPTVMYQMPGVPGDIRASMVPDHAGNYEIVIPAEAVAAGTWRYAIEVPLEGETHRFPRQGYRSFDVTAPYYIDEYLDDITADVEP